MTTHTDWKTILDVVSRAAIGNVKHHEVSLALQAVERLGQVAPTAVECGRCWWLHATQAQEGAGEEIPEHSPRCPMREERAAAWDAGYDQGYIDGRDQVLADKSENPHR